mmetsp:Transcript_13897/g.29666  ORF Transcript_13897/g.29666 Transcript_13897/m.29666 type:complete len:99 (-) Transcript_13897:61-357(-)
MQGGTAKSKTIKNLSKMEQVGNDEVSIKSKQQSKQARRGRVRSNEERKYACVHSISFLSTSATDDALSLWMDMEAFVTIYFFGIGIVAVKELTVNMND